VAGVAISFELVGRERVDAVFAELARRGENLRPLMTEIGEHLRTSTTLRFERERAPSGAPWLPTWRGGAILQDTGRLRQSITYLASDDQVEVGTNVIYAAIHHLGGTITAKNAPYLVFKAPDGSGFRRKKSVTIPARPFLGISESDEAAILEIATDYLDEVMP
jgi:phage virion morphogenesis protein